MNWQDLLKELKKQYPDNFDIMRVEVNAVYKEVDGREVRLDCDYDAIIVDFTGKYHNKYKPTIRIWKDSRVNATIEVLGTGGFSFPVTGHDEHLNERISIIPGLASIFNDSNSMAELKEIYDWIFYSYTNAQKQNKLV